MAKTKIHKKSHKNFVSHIVFVPLPRFCTRWYSDTMKRIAFIFALLTLVLTLSAVPADEYWQLFYQPDGTAIELCLMGDEHERHYEDRNGFVYEQNADGVWIRLNPAESERQITRRRQASPLSQFPRRIGEVNLAPRGLVILANYSDIAFDDSNDLAGMTDMLNGENYTYEDATGSARRYFMDQSDGQYAPWFDVVGPVTLDNPRAYYGANNGSSLDVQASQMIVDACRKADEAGVDFTLYDNDKDGLVDFVFVIFADKGEADGGPAESIWPHHWYVRRGAKKTCIVDGLYIDDYACAAEKNGRTSKRTGIGTFCHEFGHVLGLPDYYDTKSGINYSNRLTPRYWSIMDIGCYLNDSKTPPNYSAYDRYFFGWHTPTNLGTQEQRITLNPIGEDGYTTCQITTSGQSVAARTEQTVYYLECRERIGWDKYLPGHGMLIWQVKYNKSTWYNNTPNNTAYSPRYTLLSATGATTDLGTSSDSYPGKMEVTSKQLTTNRTLSDITEENQQIRFVYNRTPKTVLLTAESVLALDDQTATSSPSYTVTGSYKDANGEGYKARIQILSPVYAGNFTSTNISLANSYLEQGGVRQTPTAISGRVTISGQSLYHIDLSLTMNEFTTYRVVGDFKVNVAEAPQHALQVTCTEGGSVTLLAADYTSKTNIGSYAEGTSVQLLPSAEKGWLFSAWSGKDAASIFTTGGIYRLTMGQNDMAVDASFVRQSCEIRAASSPADKGSVTIRMGGNALTNGSSVPYQTQVTYEAVAGNGYRFDGWNDGNMTSPRTITVTSDTLLTALFSYIIPKPETHHITIASSPYGQVRLRSINTKESINSGTYQESTTVILTPEPATGYDFAGWTGDDASRVVSNNNVYSIVMGKQDYVLAAEWKKRDYTIRTECSPNGTGKIIVTANGNEIPDGGTAAYQTEITMTASPTTGWLFTHWSDNETQNPRTIQVTGDILTTAIFTRANYTLTANVSPAEKAQIDFTVNGSPIADLQAIPYETNVLLTVKPIEGWQFDKWSDGNADNPRLYTMMSNQTLTAQVSRRNFTVSAAAEPANNGVVKMTTDNKVIANGTILPYETEIEFEAIAAKSYRFDGWSDGVTTNPRKVTLTDNLTLTALFSYVVPVPENHTITISESPYGQVSLRSAGKKNQINSGTYQEGTTIVLVPEPITGYELVGWGGKDAAAITEREGVYSLIIGKQDYSIEALWQRKQYTVNLNNSPTDKGDVRIEADGATIPNGSSVAFEKQITLTAQPVTGWTFSRWSDGETQNPRTVKVTDPVELTAYYERARYTLLIAVEPADKAKVSAVAQGDPNLDLTAVPFETAVTLSVEAAEGWTLTQWSDGDKANPRTITITDNTTLTAQIARMMFVVSSAVTPVEKGSVSLRANSETITSGSELPYETEVTFEATPLNGWHFVGWSDGETDNPRTVQVTTNIGITAVMAREQYTVQTAALPVGKGEITLTANHQTLQSGEKADFESTIQAYAQPITGWQFVQWTDGETANPRTITLTQDTLLTAEYSRKQYSLQLSTSPSDKGSVIATMNGQLLDNDVILDFETTVQLYASPSTNCHFVCWSDSLTDNPRILTMTENVTLQALFARDDIAYLPLRDDADSLYYDNLANYEDAKIGLVVLQRTIKANTYSTFAMPFDVPDITETDLCGSVFQFVSATGDAEVGMTLNFTFATQIKAGVPYLLLTTDTIVNPFFKNVTMRRLESKSLRGGTVEFRSVMRPQRLMNMGKSVAAFRDNKVYYPNATAGMLLSAFRAYFYIPANANAPIRRIRILSKDETVQELPSLQPAD